jgi:protein TonB
VARVARHAANCRCRSESADASDPGANPTRRPNRSPSHSRWSINEPLPAGAQQLVHSFAIANLSAEIQEKLESRAKRPRRKYVSATTQEYRYAAYMEAWRAKVERIGNINYPEEARRRRIWRAR